MKPLSHIMIEAHIYAIAHGGKLYRVPGGYWVREEDKTKAPDCHHYSTKTIQALIDRKAAEYISWQYSRNGKFPVVALMREIPSKIKCELI